MRRCNYSDKLYIEYIDAAGVAPVSPAVVRSNYLLFYGNGCHGGGCDVEHSQVPG